MATYTRAPSFSPDSTSESDSEDEQPITEIERDEDPDETSTQYHLEHFTPGMDRDAASFSPEPSIEALADERLRQQEQTGQQSSPSRQDPRGLLKPHPVEARNTPTASKRNHAAMSRDENEGTPIGTAPAPPVKQSRKRKDPSAVSTQNPALYSGNKVKHLKKDDGEPLWRRDIQYDFLKAVFENKQKVFTNSYDPLREKETFADLYIDTMARSSKTSKILKDKLLTEHAPAKNMAMVCLLVNLGRMNTTLNFFPEMRAQLRTYHAIPSLQAHQDPNSYKQLQDAPRLKSILKGASEDRPEPATLEKIKDKVDPPRTNPVNLIFVLATFSSKVTELHFPPGRDFYDLIMGEDLSSESRARAFLWLMWFYLESDFTEEGADENPFGPGVDYDVDVRNQGVPRFDVLTKEEQERENVDTSEEQEYGYAKMRERKRIIEADQAAFQAEHGPPKRGPKPKLHLPPDDGSPATFVGRIRPKFEDLGASPASVLGRVRPKYESDIDSTRSTPPPRVLSGMRIQSVLNTGPKGRGSLKNVIVEGSSPVAHPGEPIVRRSRPLTAHQLAVERNRNQRVDYILSRGIRKVHHQAKKQRKRDGAFWRAFQRTKAMQDPFEDSEDEERLMMNPGAFRERGFGGLVQLDTEGDDFGEEFSAYASAFRRMGRRLERWDREQQFGRNPGIIGTNRVLQPNTGSLMSADERDIDETEDEKPAGHRLRPVAIPPLEASGRPREDEDDLDDMEKEILGLGSDADEEADEDLDDVEKALLNLRGDETEEEENDDWSVGPSVSVSVRV